MKPPRITPQTQARHTAWRIAFRWFAGRDLDGVERTDSTFLRWGEISVRAHVTRPSRWSRRPGWQRAGIRNTAAAAAVLTSAGFATGHDVAVIACIVSATAIAAAVTGYRIWRRGAKWQFERKWVRPLHLTIGPMLGHAQAENPFSYISLPPNFEADEDAELVIRLPSQFASSPGEKALLLDAVTSKISLGEMTPLWQTQGADPRLRLRRAPQPPSRITYADVRSEMTRAPEHSPVLGATTRGKLFAWKLDDESPHIGISMGTGAGKSVLGRLIGAQVLGSGGRLIICDIKRVSHRWVKNDDGLLPGVLYARTIEEIHHALVAVAVEGERRYDVIDRFGEDVAQEFPRVVLMIEEINGTMQRLTRWWEASREKTDPKR